MTVGRVLNHVQIQRQTAFYLNHVSAVSSTPKYDCSRTKRISWSMVSKASDRSSNTTMEILPSSILASRSLVTRVRAVSVLCPVRYAD